MTSFRFEHVCLEAWALNLPPNEVTSAELEDRIAPLYQRLGIPFGTLEKLSGIKSRRFWDNSVSPSIAATKAAEDVLEQLPFEKDQLGAIFNCSVTRDYFEPATACIVHQNLGLSEHTMALDITNACIGFSNGLALLGNLIESGVVKAGILVAGETMSKVLDSTIEMVLRDESIQREDLLKILPTFTLGSGAAACVLCHDSISQGKHHIRGSVTRSATQFNDLCNGNGDYHFHQTDNFNPIMYTESNQLMSSAATLGSRMWKDTSRFLEWTTADLDHIFCHQVGKQVNEAFYREMGLPMDKEFTVYRELGNLVSAAVPSALFTGIEEKGVSSGDKILVTAFGSGLNSIFTGIEW